MLQQVMTNPGEIIFREVPVPEVKDDQVLVKIMNIGICGSSNLKFKLICQLFPKDFRIISLVVIFQPIY